MYFFNFRMRNLFKDLICVDKWLATNLFQITKRVVSDESATRNKRVDSILRKFFAKIVLLNKRRKFIGFPEKPSPAYRLLPSPVFLFRRRPKHPLWFHRGHSGPGRLWAAPQCQLFVVGGRSVVAVSAGRVQCFRGWPRSPASSRSAPLSVCRIPHTGKQSSGNGGFQGKKQAVCEDFLFKDFMRNTKRLADLKKTRLAQATSEQATTKRQLAWL